MATYTQLHTSDIERIEAIYDLKIEKYEPIEEQGNNNSNWYLKTSKGRYMLTIAEDNTFEEVEYLVHLMQHLRQNGFKSNKTLRSHKIAVHNWHGKPFYVKKFIKGKTIDSLSDKQLAQAGKALAQLHLTPVEPKLPNHYLIEEPKYREVIGLNIDVKYEEWLAQQYNKFAPILKKKLPKGIVHGDLFADNIIFRKGEYKAIIDFEMCCNYFFVFDIGMAFVGVCSDDYHLNLKKAKAFMAGYQQVRLLKKKEIKYLKSFTEYAATSMSNWRYWNYNHYRPNPERKTWHWQLGNLAIEIGEISNEVFCKNLFSES